MCLSSCVHHHVYYDVCIIIPHIPISIRRLKSVISALHTSHMKRDENDRAKAKKHLWAICCMRHLVYIYTYTHTRVHTQIYTQILMHITEVMAGRPFDSKADVYGYSILCWEITFCREWDAGFSDSELNEWYGSCVYVCICVRI